MWARVDSVAASGAEQSLDVSMSGIDDTAGFALARATHTHKTLTSLDLSHNAITAAATMVR